MRRREAVVWRGWTWLRLAGRELAAGLVAMGQGLGAFTPPECHGTGPVGEGPDADAGCVPGPGHPERLVAVPVSALSSAEQAVWRQLDDVWERAEPALRTRRSPRLRRRPRHG
ncbi:DUF6059 family protein [Streptomyces sp. JNUCC 63]